MPSLDKRFALISNTGEPRYPYIDKNNVFTVSEAGIGDRFGNGVEVRDIESVIDYVINKKWNVRATTHIGGQVNSVGFGKVKFPEYWVAPEFRHLVQSASRKPLDRLPGVEAEKPADPLPEALKRAEQSGNQADQRVLREIQTRRGQKKFREALIKSYKGHCCVTGCDVEAVLEAAHIVGHAEESNYSVSNGMLLRADIHTLFDLKLLTVDTDYQIQVDSTLMESEYGALEGKSISLPDDKSEWPDIKSLEARSIPS